MLLNHYRRVPVRSLHGSVNTLLFPKSVLPPPKLGLPSASRFKSCSEVQGKRMRIRLRSSWTIISHASMRMDPLVLLLQLTFVPKYRVAEGINPHRAQCSGMVHFPPSLLHRTVLLVEKTDEVKTGRPLNILIGHCADFPRQVRFRLCHCADLSSFSTHEARSVLVKSSLPFSSHTALNMLAASVQDGFQAASATLKSWLMTSAETIIHRPFLVTAILVSTQLTTITKKDKNRS